MAVSLGSVKRYRKTYSRIRKIIDIPNLIDIQKRSYDRFLQADVPIAEREPIGLQGVFSSIFPIKDFSGTSSLEFVCYKLEKPKYDVKECMQRGMTYAAPFKVVIRLVVWDTDDETGRQDIRDIKEQEVYFGDIPLMTDSGTFIVNGTERVIVSQLHRSPGVFFDHDKGRTHVSGKLLYNARVIPYRGSWLDFEFDTKDILHVRIDRRRKMPATILLKALGYTADEILAAYYNSYYKKLGIRLRDDGQALMQFVPEWFQGLIAPFDIVHGETVFVKKNKRVTQGAVMKMTRSNIKDVLLTDDDISGMYLGEDVVDLSTGEVVGEISQEVTPELIAEMRERGINEFVVLHTGTTRISTSLRDTLIQDKTNTPLEAMIEIYKRLRPGDPPTVDTATTLFQNLFFNAERYDLSRVGRVKMNFKLGRTTDVEQKTLSRDDILAVVFYLLNLKEGIGDAEIDDIDHLGNRRVRAVGELVENQYRIGLVRMERAIRERMSLQEIDTLMPHDLINSKPVSAVIKEFFGSSQLSQFMDQTNPLSEVTHKRRLSALGPGGLTRERAGFEVRDVHNTHYGRICPVETPEGPNIGLIASLSTYARVNEYGFIETPYRPVSEDGVVSSQALFLSALEEERYAIAQANIELDEKGRFVHPTVSARNRGEFSIVPSKDVQYMDVSPNQLVSVAASLIPFLSHDDANRALMGANMQRQAVPLLKTAAPVVGTGMENIVARDSGVTSVARRGGVVIGVDAERIVVKVNENEHNDSEAGVDVYRLIKYQRSNQNTCINQKPIVKLGEKVVKGDIIADGPSTDLGELALGQNITVAFMPWGGYNFEDSILISEALIKDDRFTSVHIEVFECISRDTKLGKEEITRDIPNVSEEMLANLDDAGIIRIGAEVKPGDILVGKISPKGETQLSPEEKLLRAIFGEKAGDVRDTSLTVPPGVYGTVLDAKVYSRKGVEKDQRALEIENFEIAKILVDQEEEIRIYRQNAIARIKGIAIGQKVTANLTSDYDGKVIVKKGAILSEEILDGLDFTKIGDLSLDDAEIEGRVTSIINTVQGQIDAVREHWQEKIDRVKRSDEMAPGVIKMVRVYVAIKRKLQVGDKLAGRHGNKGVLSRVVPEEDMPYMEDGRPVEMLLNPLGVPSRMNVGQILETHLGRAATVLGEQIDAFIREKFSAAKIREFLLSIYADDLASLKPLRDQIKKASEADLLAFARALSRGVHMAIPVFDGASEDDIKHALEMAKVQLSGQASLFDGRTGDLISNEVTVGTMYMLKLHHLVDDKIHARSIGPYSLVTQQPLGGKAQFGGQRLGEMEVWAMEAYGAAYTLQEFLTVKSDDVAGRTRMYESIVKGEYQLEPGLPESFNVLVKELQSLSLDVTLLEDGMTAEEAAAAAAAVAPVATPRAVPSAIDAAEALFSKSPLDDDLVEESEEEEEEAASEGEDEDL